VLYAVYAVVYAEEIRACVLQVGICVGLRVLAGVTVVQEPGFLDIVGDNDAGVGILFADDVIVAGNWSPVSN
jgi:hypothetical protein